MLCSSSERISHSWLRVFGGVRHRTPGHSSARPSCARGSDCCPLSSQSSFSSGCSYMESSLLLLPVTHHSCQRTALCEYTGSWWAHPTAGMAHPRAVSCQTAGTALGQSSASQWGLPWLSVPLGLQEYLKGSGASLQLCQKRKHFPVIISGNRRCAWLPEGDGVSLRKSVLLLNVEILNASFSAWWILENSNSVSI